MLNRAGLLFFCTFLSGCVTGVSRMPDNFIYTPIRSGDYDIAVWQKISDHTAPIRIYIEGDGYAFDIHGTPTRNPTPHGDTVRKMAMRDASANVVYIARPCQYIMSDACDVSDWTSGRFSARAVSATADVVRQISGTRPIILIGYSGGALLSGLIITQNPDLNISQWITVAGVLNHDDWTKYFGDMPLTDSVNMDELPHVPQCHFVASNDTVVPYKLSQKWTHGNMTVIPETRHNDFGDFVPNCVNND